MNPDGSDQRRLANGGVPGCGHEAGPAWSPDGRRIAIVSDGQFTTPTKPPYGFGETDIYVMNADGSGQRRLTRTAGSEHSPAWSPDGRTIAFSGRGGIYVMNADGSGRQNLAPGGLPAWSPDGRKIAFVSSDGIYVMNADGSGQRLLTRAAVSYPALAWSPDGRRIAFVSNRQVWVMNADGSGQRSLTRTNGARNVAPAWSPNGQRIAFERRVGRHKYRNTALEYGQCSRCEGRVRFQVYVMNADGSEARKLAHYSRNPVWSSDGRKIAFEYPIGPRGPGGLGKQTDIYVMNADGSGKRNLTRTRRIESQPVWSPAQR
jgi:Tol biopolymer transport system component